MVAGAMKIPFKKFLMMNFLGEIVLVGILLFLGYFLGNAYNMLSDNLKYYFIA
jgi:membrane protein DedA with SNARE-associated domain